MIAYSVCIQDAINYFLANVPDICVIEKQQLKVRN